MDLVRLFKRYMKVPDPEKAHAKLSASGSERWLCCPGSVRLSEGIPGTDNEASIRGTNTHTLLQFILENHQWKQWLSFREAVPFKKFIGWDEAMQETAEFAARTVWEMKDQMAKKSGQPVMLLAEQKLELDGVGFGTSNVILYQPFGRLHVIDYKNGVKAVEPEGNTQGLYYGVAAADRYGWNFSYPSISIIQPNARHSRGPVRTWSTSYTELDRAGTRLRLGAKKTENKNAPLNPGGWCYFCPARPSVRR